MSKSPVAKMRESLGLNQSDFARGLGVSLTCIWQCEKGLSRNPGLIWESLEQAGYAGLDELIASHHAWLDSNRLAFRL